MEKSAGGTVANKSAITAQNHLTSISSPIVISEDIFKHIPRTRFYRSKQHTYRFYRVSVSFDFVRKYYKSPVLGK
ncbi:MAG: hypothetical protein ACFNKL_07080 [Treponema sp.]